MPINSQSKAHFDAVISLPFCHLGLSFSDETLKASEYLPPDSDIFQTSTPALSNVVKQLNKYIDNPGYRFQFSLAPEGTDFQRRVWQLLTEIPAGATLTYGEVAKQLSSSARAVGNACRANPLPLIIPCHRVVSAQGIGGFGGETSGYLIDIKRQLLRHEGLEL